MYAETEKVIVGRIIFEFSQNLSVQSPLFLSTFQIFTAMKWLKKSNTVNLPIINANEAKYEDCVHILRTYEKWIAIYVKAGFLEKISDVETLLYQKDQQQQVERKRIVLTLLMIP